MNKQAVIHMIEAMENTSPFDINMAVDAGFDVVVPYSNVKLEQINSIVQDAIFSRGPKGVKSTNIFIGGNDIHVAMDMLKACKNAMMPPFEISVLVDPKGAFTTAAALVACVEKELKDKHGTELKNSRAIVFGGTGPVGIATGVIVSLAGANTTIVSHLSIEEAQSIASQYNNLFNSSMYATYGCSDADKSYLLSNADIAFCTAKAGVEILNDRVLGDAQVLKVAGDVNAIPPLGIRGLKVNDFGEPLKHTTGLDGAVGIGALAIGNIKYQLQAALLHMMLESDKPIYLDFVAAFEKARELV